MCIRDRIKDGSNTYKASALSSKYDDDNNTVLTTEMCIRDSSHPGDVLLRMLQQMGRLVMGGIALHGAELDVYKRQP